MLTRIIIIGCPGSGKTTLSKKLSDKLRLPLVHLDQLGWRGKWEMTPKEEFDRLLFEELIKPQWIIEGNYNRTIPDRLLYCDTVIYLDFPALTCFFGVLKRVIKGYGKVRSDMGGNCTERIDFSFLKYVLGFNKSHRKDYYTMLNSQKNIKLILLKNRRQAAEFLRKL